MVGAVRGVPSAFFAFYGLTPLFRSLGVLTGNQGLIDFGDDLSTPTGAFIAGTLLIVALVAIFAMGLNRYFRVQNVLFVIAMVGAFLTIAILAFKSRGAFESGFNASLVDVAGEDAYGNILSAARDSGFQTAPFSLYWTLIPMTWIYLGTRLQPVLGLHRRGGQAPGLGPTLVDAVLGRRLGGGRDAHRLGA